MVSTISVLRARAHESGQRASVGAAGHERAPRDGMRAVEARDRSASADDEGRARRDGRTGGVQGRDQGEVEADADDHGDEESAGGAAGMTAADERAADDRERGEAEGPGQQEEEGRSPIARSSRRIRAGAT